MEDMLYTSYKGFYCSICNQKNHEFVNETRKTI